MFVVFLQTLLDSNIRIFIKLAKLKYNGTTFLADSLFLAKSPNDCLISLYISLINFGPTLYRMIYGYFYWRTKITINTLQLFTNSWRIVIPDLPVLNIHS